MKMPEDVSKSKKKLAAMSMPQSRGDKALELDLAMPAEDASDSQEEDPDHDGDDDSMDSKDNPDMNEDMGASAPASTSGMGASLSKVSDDQLLAELKKRGLDKDMDSGADDRGSDYESNDDDSQGGYSLRA